MKMRRDQNSVGLQFILFCIVLVYSLPKPSEAYENYTVGDSFGWYDNTEKPEVNYQKWAQGKNFSLGDFLLFHTNTNHSVIQTYNETIYKLCDSSGSDDSDAIQWSVGDPSNTETRPVTVPVPLLKVGKTFFFSGDYDGDQCFNGQRFSISVARGQGLPPSLRDPADDSPGPASGPSAGDNDEEESAPDTNVPANFDHPKEVPDNDSDTDEKQSSPSGASDLSRVFTFAVVVLLGFVAFIV